MRIFYILNGVSGTRIHTIVKRNQTLQLRAVHFNVCKLRSIKKHHKF